MNGYESYHPAVQFLYYALAVGFSMVSMHPVVIAASIIGGMLLFSIRNTPRKIVEELFFFFCLFILYIQNRFLRSKFFFFNYYHSISVFC